MRTGSYVRRPHRAGVAAGLVVVLAACSSGGQLATDTAATTPTPEPTAAPPTTRGTIDVPATDVPATAAVEAAPPTIAELDEEQLGDIDVTTPARLPRLELAWTSSELDLPDAGTGTGWLVHTGFLGDEYVAVANAWPTPDRQVVATWRSNDGEHWSRTETQLPVGDVLHEVFVLDGRLGAVGQRTSVNEFELALWYVDAIGGWQPVDLAASGIDPIGVTTFGTAVSDAGVVIAAERGQYLPSPPVTFDAGGFRIELDEGLGTYVLTEVATAREVASGPTTDIYPWREGGQAIWDVDTGELIVVVPWDVWAGAPVPVSQLPIPTSVDPAAGGPVPIEWDGVRIVVDYERDRFEVSDVDSGEIVTSGPLDALYRGPSPTFVDDATGEVVLAITWDEWDLHMQAAYENPVDPLPAVEVPRLALFSADGVSWSEADIGNATESYISSVWSLADVFHITTVDYRGGEPVATIHSSRDGMTWTSQLAPEQTQGQIAAGPAGAIALSWHEPLYAPVIAVSDDGVTWTTALSPATQTDGMAVSLDLVASGPGGRATLASLYPSAAPEALTITIGTRTARFPTMGDGLEVVDEVTGDVLLVATMEELERAAQEGAVPIATYADGVTTLWADGAAVMAIPDAAVSEAYAEQHRRHVEQIDHVLFLERAGQWYEVPLPPLGEASVQRLVVGADAIVVGVVEFDGEPIEFEESLTTMRVLVGRAPPATAGS